MSGLKNDNSKHVFPPFYVLKEFVLCVVYGLPLWLLTALRQKM